MKRYIKSSTVPANSNAVAIAEYVFGPYFREDYRVSIYKQVKGYALKYFAPDGHESAEDAEDMLDQMLDTAKDLDIPVLRKSVKRGFIMGSVSGTVACIVVPTGGEV